MNYKKFPNRFLRGFITAPFIYILFPFILLLDIFLEIYHHVCFPLYQMHLIKRNKYIKIDRHKLKYLNWFEKLNCIYCGYANGFLHYASVIAAETEKYWCGIKHSKDKNFIPPNHHKDFLEYGDGEAFRRLKK